MSALEVVQRDTCTNDNPQVCIQPHGRSGEATFQGCHRAEIGRFELEQEVALLGDDPQEQQGTYRENHQFRKSLSTI